MTLVTNYVAGPYQGVSQAPPQVRLPDACEAMEDCTATIPNGIQRRPPWRLVSKLSAYGGGSFAIGASPLMVDVPRGSPSTDVIFLLNMEGGVVKPHLFNASTGAAINITVTAAATAYLALNSPTTPNQQFRCCPVEDYVFITNRTVTVANGSATSPARNPEALLWVKLGNYGRSYKVDITPAGHSTVSASFTTPTGASGSDAQWVDTSVILSQLLTYGSSPNPLADNTFPGNNAKFVGTILGSSGLTSYLTLTRTNAILYIQSQSAADFTIVTGDGSGGSAMYAIKGSVQNFSSLPLVGVDGMVVKIAQSAAGGNSDFYVKYVTTGSQPTGGVWRECVAPGANLGVDTTTMPIALTVSGGVWTLDAVAWTGRTTGDTTLSPDPGFIGDQITDIRWWRGRLVLVYNGGVSISTSNNPFTFYTTTLAVTLDSDPIGLLTPADRKTFFKQAFTFDQRLFVFADRIQAAVTSGGSPVTPQTTTMALMSQSAFSDLSPVQQGNHKVRYLANRTASSIVYTLSIDRLSGLALEQDVSTAIPSYIPNTIDTASTWEADYTTVWGTAGSNLLYVGVYREQDYQGVQNAYLRWRTPSGFTLAGLFFKAGVILAYLADGSGAPYYCTLDTTPNYVTQGRDATASTVQQFMDLMLDDTILTNTAGVLTGTGIVSGRTYMVTLRAAWGGYPEGYIVVPPTLTTAASITLPVGFKTGSPPLWVGLQYDSYFDVSKWYITGQDKKPEHSGRLQMKRLKADIAQYGYLYAKVNQRGRTQRTYLFEGTNLDDPYTPLDAPPNEATTVLMIPLSGNSEDLSVRFGSNNNLGFKFLGYEWEADFNPRTRRVS